MDIKDMIKMILCLLAPVLLSSSGYGLDVHFFVNFDDQNIDGWTVTEESNGDVSTSCVHYHGCEDALLVSSENCTDVAFGTSPSISIDDTESYTISLQLRLDDEFVNHYFYVLYNGQIKCIVGYDLGANYFAFYWIDNVGSRHYIMDLETDTWHLIRWIMDSDQTNPRKYHISVDDMGYYIANATLESQYAIGCIEMGDDAYFTNYGLAYYDNINITQGSLSYLFDFNDDDLDDWTITTYNYGRFVSTIGDAPSGSYSLLIDSPNPASIAYAETYEYFFDEDSSYIVTVWIYLIDADYQNIHVPFNGQINCILGDIEYSNNLYWIDDDTSTDNLGPISPYSWHCVRFVVDSDQSSPRLCHISIDDMGYYIANETLNSGSALDYLCFRDDSSMDGCGTLYIDDIRLDQ